MKKLLFLIVSITIMLLQTVYGQVTKPASGDLFHPGDASSIEWIHFDLSTTSFTIELIQGIQVITSESTGSLIAGTQGYVVLWTVPNVSSGNNYQIRITPQNGGNPMLSGVFSIIEQTITPPSTTDYLEVTLPNGGEYYTQDRPLDISWKWEESGVETFTFSLSNGAGSSYLLGTYTPQEPILVGPDGIAEYSYTFNIPVSIPDGDYYCQISSPQRSDGSDETFFVGTLPDKLFNLIESKTFTYKNGQKKTLSSGKSFFDNRGRLLQSQSLNLTENNVMATQPIYDQYDRIAAETLPAPTGQPQMSFKQGFITVNEEDYSQAHLMQSAPEAVDKDKEGTLGWYYSDNNTLEPQTAISQYPFSRTEYYNDGTGQVKRSALPGDVFHENNIRKVSGKSFPVLSDLDGLYLDVRNLLLGEATGSLAGQAIKMVARDANGIETVSYMDTKENVLASGFGYLESNERVDYDIDIDNVDISHFEWFDFHVPVSKAVTRVGGITKNLLDNQVVSTSTLSKGYYRCEGCTSIDYDFRYYNMSFSFFDRKGRIILSVSPKGVEWLLANEATLSELQVRWDSGDPNDFTIPFATYYEYDFEGRLLSMKEPDAGITKYMYRKDGNIRFSENALQRENGRFSYTNYDKMGRPVESGEYVGEAFAFGENLNSILENTDPTGGLVLTLSDRKDWVRTYYDLPDESITESFNSLGVEVDVELQSYSVSNKEVVASNSITLKPGFEVTAGNEFAGSIDPNATGVVPDFTLPDMQEYTYGTVSYSENENTKTWYSYDELGRVKWMAAWYKQIFDEPKVISYYYDFTGNMVSVKYQEGETDGFYHHYVYDADNRISEVYASENVIDSNAPQQEFLQATYDYYLHGPLKSVKLADGLQNIDYYYTIQGWLKSINDPDNMYSKGELDDRFAQTFNYFNGDYASRDTNLNTSGIVNEQFTGNIAGLDWQTIRSTSHGHTTTGNFSYTYDGQYQLKEATDGTETFRVSNLRYDANGNIKSLNRNDGLGNPKDIFTYGYTNQFTNQLTSVSGYATQYTYDAIGQMILQSLTDNTIMKPKYDVSGKVEEIYDGSDVLKLIYEYDDRGFRVRKKDLAGGGKETIYVRDASGQLLSTYIREVNESVYKQEESPVYGSSKLGLWQHVESGIPDVSFELKDHLGNIRALLSKNNENVSYTADYYPFGSVMREFGSKSKYGYQGDFAEKDEETGWNHFELREYDPVLGRWLSVDPMRQHYSPYVSMGNNPINRWDPDGGMDGDPEAVWFVNIAEGRVILHGGTAIGATISAAIFIAEDTHGNHSIGITIAAGPAIGLGYTFGALTSVGVVYTNNGNVSDLDGLGWNAGGFIGAPLVNFPGITAEYTSSIDVESIVNNSIAIFSGLDISDSDEGVQDGFTVPHAGSFLPWFGRSFGGGLYGELSYTWTISLGANSADAQRDELLESIPPDLIDNALKIIEAKKNKE